MGNGLLTTKITAPPLQPQWLERVTLRNALNQGWQSAEGFGRVLTLLCSPAGFGKTVTARQWLRNDNQLAWFSIDHRDNELRRFWHYLTGALAQVEPRIIGPLVPLFAPGSSLGQKAGLTRKILESLLNALAEIQKPLVLVLDDYHWIEEEEIHQSMVFLVEHLPPQVHLVIISRAEPSWPLVQWQREGQMLAFRQNELSLDRKETADLLQALTGDVDDTLADILYSKTKGGVGDLRLAALALRKNGDLAGYVTALSGSQDHARSFLTEAFLRHLPIEHREFLLKVSVAERICPALCDHLTGCTDSEWMLERLTDGEMFLDRLDGDWFRLHPFFRERLLLVLEEQESSQKAGLHRKAGSWLEDAGLLAEALDQADAAGDKPWVGSLLEDHVDELWADMGAQFLGRWIEELPQAVLLGRPFLIPCKAMILMNQEKQEELVQVLALENQVGELTAEKQEEFEAMLDLVRAQKELFAGRFDQAFRYLGRGRSLRRSEHKLWQNAAGFVEGEVAALTGDLAHSETVFWEVFWANQFTGDYSSRYLAGFKILNNLVDRGFLHRATEVAERFLQEATDDGVDYLPQVGGILAVRGEIYRQQGLLSEADQTLTRGIQICRTDIQLRSQAHYLALWLAFSGRKWLAARGHLAVLSQLSHSKSVPALLFDLAQILEARILIGEDRLDEASALLDRYNVTMDGSIQTYKESGPLALARLLIRKDQADLAHDLLAQLEHVVDRRDRLTMWLEIRLVQAQCLAAQERRDIAMEVLEEALDLAAPQEAVQLFLDEGPGMIRLLSELSEDSVVGFFAKSILQAAARQKIWGEKNRFIRPGAAERKTAAAEAPCCQWPDAEAVATLTENLSGREWEILHLIGAGKTTDDITGMLRLSVGTVKWHTSNICGKLRVTGRNEAADRIRQWGLLDGRQQS